MSIRTNRIDLSTVKCLFAGDGKDVCQTKLTPKIEKTGMGKNRAWDIIQKTHSCGKSWGTGRHEKTRERTVYSETGVVDSSTPKKMVTEAEGLSEVDLYPEVRVAEMLPPEGEG